MPRRCIILGPLFTVTVINFFVERQAKPVTVASSSAAQVAGE
jgi:hypothetical protein